MRNHVTLTARLLGGLASHFTAIVLVGAAIACFAMSGCSPGADYPSIFPAVHDMPPPRTEAPLDAKQVQQATEDLISDRNRLSEAQGASGKALANPPPKPPNSATAAKKTPASPVPAAASTQTTGAETK